MLNDSTAKMHIYLDFDGTLIANDYISSKYTSQELEEKHEDLHRTGVNHNLLKLVTSLAFSNSISKKRDECVTVQGLTSMVAQRQINAKWHTLD